MAPGPGARDRRARARAARHAASRSSRWRQKALRRYGFADGTSRGSTCRSGLRAASLPPGLRGLRPLLSGARTRSRPLSIPTPRAAPTAARSARARSGRTPIRAARRRASRARPRASAARRSTLPASAAVVTARSHVRTPARSREIVRRPSRAYLRIRYGSPVSLKSDARTARCRRPRTRSARAASSSERRPSHTRLGAARQAWKSWSWPDSASCHSPISSSTSSRHALGDGAQQLPVGPVPRWPSETATTVAAGLRRRERVGGQRRRARRAALGPPSSPERVGDDDVHARAQRSRERVQVLQPLALAAATRRRRPRSGPTASTTAPRPGAGPSARGRAGTARVEDHDDAAARPGAAARRACLARGESVADRAPAAAPYAP